MTTEVRARLRYDNKHERREEVERSRGQEAMMTKHKFEVREHKHEFTKEMINGVKCVTTLGGELPDVQTTSTQLVNTSFYTAVVTK
jgi:hypothetical protein